METRRVNGLPLTQHGASAANVLYTTFDAPNLKGSASLYSMVCRLCSASRILMSSYHSMPPTVREQAESSTILPLQSLSSIALVTHASCTWSVTQATFPM